MKLDMCDENKLKDMIKEALRDVLEEEVKKIRLLLTPYISNEEQKEIEERYGEPSNDVAKTLNIDL